MSGPLAGKRILVVEDEPIVAMTVEDMIVDLGGEVVGPASRLEQALELAATEPLDAALLDVNLRGERSYGVAEMLARRRVPFAYATGYGEAGLDAGHAKAPTLTKPYRLEDVAAVLRDLLAGDRSPRN